MQKDFAILRTPGWMGSATQAGVAVDINLKRSSDSSGTSSIFKLKLVATLLRRAWCSLKSSGGLPIWEGPATALSGDDECTTGGGTGSPSFSLGAGVPMCCPPCWIQYRVLTLVPAAVCPRQSGRTGGNTGPALWARPQVPVWPLSGPLSLLPCRCCRCHTGLTGRRRITPFW